MSAAVPVVTVTAEPPPDRSRAPPHQILPFIVFGGVAVAVLLAFVSFSLIVSTNQARRIHASRTAEAQDGEDDLRRLEEAVPSGVLRDDRMQVPTSREGGSETVCVICLEKLAVGHVVRNLPCRHTFHTSCIDQWFRSRRYTCPICIAPYFVPP